MAIKECSVLAWAEIHREYLLTSLARDDNQPPAPRVKRQAQRCRQKQKRREEALNPACCQPGKTEIGHQCFFYKKHFKKKNYWRNFAKKRN
jgi:hypothetical protein